ncbi:hypothetical protein PR001_g5816 [Phytophthora rubi]|uniref:Uncharacterized protein n=1 Tax=Phytophthora rubi TaxID=129364 RepID=A0A6A3NSF4_9STRA|nr:hypothetical protein PR002_g6138 [Phytophthora rubi]KAE9043375.1 hypothetical protein PR001_g5816 [Phytophthora rubi]
MRHPRVPSVLGAVAPSLSGGGYPVSTKPNSRGGENPNKISLASSPCMNTAMTATKCVVPSFQPSDMMANHCGRPSDISPSTNGSRV